MSIKPIHSAKDHQDALAEIATLMETAQKATPEGDRLEILLTLVHAYERENIRFPSLDPIEAVLFRMDQLGLEAKDLLGVFGTPARASDVIGRRKPLTLRMIRKLHQKLEIPFESLASEYELKRA